LRFCLRHQIHERLKNKILIIYFKIKKLQGKYLGAFCINK